MTKARILADYVAGGTTAAEFDYMDGVTSNVQTQLDAEVTSRVAMGFQSVPHIIPGVLYPAVAGKLLDGSTSHSGAYGTAQSDSRNYYYTDIKGSKPIKDPRIGAHFGSQRYRFSSLQLLEQETATHGANVHSVDGREFIRYVGETTDLSNDANSMNITLNNTDNWLEVTGYFNAVNVAVFASSGTRTANIIIDGVTAHSALAMGATVDSPLSGRYVSPDSLINIDITSASSLSSDTTLGIHTFKYQGAAANNTSLDKIELIAHGLFTDATCDYNNDPTISHDANTKMVAGMSVTGTGIPTGATIASVTSTTAFELSASTTGGAVTNGTLTFGVADLIIPAQNVVSYGKKFAISEVAQHYDPFNGFTNSTSLHSAFVDTATSLGLSTGTLHGASWDKGGGDEIRPFNGGRVVKWIASDGTIKTSVTMMPPNAQNIGANVSNGGAGVAHNEIPTPSATNTVTTPCFSDDVIDNSIAEVAKTFQFREFGNGAVNGGTEATWADASMLNTADDILYLMDDGLTGITAETPVAVAGHSFVLTANGKDCWITFIGTGVSVEQTSTSSLSWVHRIYIDGVLVTDGTGQTFNGAGTKIMAQNLPYGTHILKIKCGDSSGNAPNWNQISIFQPKKPPIPEDACIIADYMLMADFVAAGATASTDELSKGVRRINCSRDWFYNSAMTLGTSGDANRQPRGNFGYEQDDAFDSSLPYFGTHAVFENHPHGNRMNNAVLAGSSQNLETNTHIHVSESTMGQQDATIVGSQNDEYVSIPCIDVHTPIHTSSHYQTFETPYLYELVGGDRNMEQTNLVVTPDGKTWDEVTRDVSYIGAQLHVWNFITGNVTTDVPHASSTGTPWVCRGKLYGNNYGNKNFAYAYDRHICLVDGEYEIYARSYHETSWGEFHIKVNGTIVGMWARSAEPDCITTGRVTQFLKRGDYVQITGGHLVNSSNLSRYQIKKI